MPPGCWGQYIQLITVVDGRHDTCFEFFHEAFDLACLAKLDTQNIESLLETDVGAALDALETLLTSADLRDLINPEVLTTVQESSTPAFHVADIVAGIKNHWGQPRLASLERVPG